MPTSRCLVVKGSYDVFVKKVIYIYIYIKSDGIVCRRRKRESMERPPARDVDVEMGVQTKADNNSTKKKKENPRYFTTTR